MKRILFYRLSLTIVVGIIGISSSAQTPMVRNAAKSVFTLTTYDADGAILATSKGVFIGNGGEGISNLSPFLGAARATVTDVKGTEMNVRRMIGINELYDVARFRVEGKTSGLSLPVSSASSGSQLWLVPYSTDAKTQPVSATVASVETFMDKYSYYILSVSSDDMPVRTKKEMAFCPFVNDAGEVVGLMQLSSTSDKIYAADARFTGSLVFDGLTFNNVNMQKTSIPSALPDNIEQAQIMLVMLGHSGDSAKYDAAVSDFIEQYPTLSDGYVARAQQYTAAGRFKDADDVFSTAMKKVADKADAHFSYAGHIYNKMTSDARPYAPWTLAKALDEAEQAYAISPLSMYKHLEAQIYYSMTEYQAAYDIFTALANDNDFNKSELIFEAAQCKQMLGAPDEEILAMLDSAINMTDSMRIAEASPYFLMRAEVNNALGRYREAVFDYTRYAIMTQQVLTSDFYYVKAQTEIKGKLYQQALADLARAVILSPDEPLYIAELTSLYLRVNQVENALKTAEHCIEKAPEYSTGYVLYGLALIRSDRKAEGIAALEKAEAMGDEQARALIDKYSD